MQKKKNKHHLYISLHVICISEVLEFGSQVMLFGSLCKHAQQHHWTSNIWQIASWEAALPLLKGNGKLRGLVTSDRVLVRWIMWTSDEARWLSLDRLPVLEYRNWRASLALSLGDKVPFIVPQSLHKTRTCSWLSGGQSMLFRTKAFVITCVLYKSCTTFQIMEHVFGDKPTRRHICHKSLQMFN